jgi:hypothetical protein
MRTLFRLILIIVLVWGGYYYYTHHKATVDNAITDAKKTKDKIVETTIATTDATIKSAVGSVSPISFAYYAKNRNYGESPAKNICNDSTSSASIGSIISSVQALTSSVSCTMDTVFPARSFTLIASSLLNKGQYYCTDQNGGVNLIPSISTGSSFKAGMSCR